MFANFTEETCTGTGDTLTLLGNTTGMIPYSASFADGALVAYVVKDSAGTIKVAGVGKYAAAGNTITRTDIWNYTGAAVNNYPSSNIALSAGTHTVLCEIVGSLISGLAGAQQSYEDGSGDGTQVLSGHVSAASGSGSLTLTVDRQYSAPFLLKYPKEVTGLRCGVKTAVASSITEIGISRMFKGESDTVYLERGNIDTLTTGNQKEYTFASSRILTPDWYFVHVVSTNAIAIEYVGNASQNWSPIDGVVGEDRNTPGSYNYLGGVSGGSLVADPSTVTSSQFNQSYPNIWLV